MTPHPLSPIETREVAGDLLLRRLHPAGHADATVVMVPSSCHGWRAWVAWAEALAASGLATVALSFPNHADAPEWPAERFLSLTLPDAAAMVRWVAAREAGPVFLCGHSLGGIICQVAAQDMHGLTGLILVASSGPSQLGSTRDGGYPADRPVIFEAGAARERWFADADPAAVDWALARLSPESPALLNGSGGRARVDAGAIRCPVLVVSAGRDRSSVPAGERLAAFYGAAHRHLPEAGHDLMLERGAGRAVRGVIAWMDAVLAATGRSAAMPRWPERGKVA